MTDLDIVPYRIQGGAGKPLKQADQYLESIMCPYVRSCFDLAMSGEYDFLSGVVIPHTCDAMHRIYDIWKYNMKPLYSHCLTVPHMTHKASFEYFQQELEDLRHGLERFAGRPASEQDLLNAIELHNRSRSLLRELYALRKHDPPPVTGTEITRVLVAGMTIPVGEFNALLEDVISEVRERKEGSDRKPRLLISGSEVDDVSLVSLVEDCGASVVMDDVCTGSRAFWKDVIPTNGALNGLAERYLGGITCPCTYREGRAPERFSYLGDFIRDWDVKGVLLYTIRFCDTYQLDAPEIKEYIGSLGLPVLYLEDDYIMPPLAQWRTRIEAFLETIEAGEQELI
ncbi:MAG: 2-hydroxyacyl-CoA dehydratase family protein [Dehalococcoidia bacterium]|nr:2-hydroxyacyl-CoA dehydratase family protein [Dehalococcoidia bacterium]